MSQFKILLIGCTFFSIIFAKETLPSSGGPLPELQSKFDVHYYNLYLKIDPQLRSISGSVTIRFTATKEMDTLMLNLLDRYTVSDVSEKGNPLSFSKSNNVLYILLSRTLMPGQTGTITVAYSGIPPVAAQPPWSGGFTWTADSTGQPWVAVSCQDEGAKIWWPCKDHPSDEPDSAEFHFTVPENLVCAGNGLLVSVTDAQQGWKTWHWKTRYPINLYDVTFALGDYVTVSRSVTGIAPVPVPLVYYVLKSDTTGAGGLLNQAETMLKFYARHFGRFPFYKEKFGLAESPFWGMETQTLNAYGNHYRNTKLGYDFLMLHEMGHEWWGNSVTVHDWADFWLHEGIDIYAEGMFIRENYGEKAYRKFFTVDARKRIENKKPIVAAPNSNARESYTIDVYYKAGFALYMLGQIIDPDVLEQILRELVTDPQFQGLNGITTDDFIRAVESKTDEPLEAFFQAYFYQASLPYLREHIRHKSDKTILKFSVDYPGLKLPLPVMTLDGEDTTRTVVWIGDKVKEVQFPGRVVVRVDPEDDLLLARGFRAGIRRWFFR